MFAEFLFQVLWFGEECDAVIGPNSVPKVPAFGHVLRILGHDLPGGDKPQNRDLRKAAEEELFVSGSLKPLSSLFRMHVPAPQQREPNIGIKEIQRVHKYVRWSNLPWGLLKQ